MKVTKRDLCNSCKSIGNLGELLDAAERGGNPMGAMMAYMAVYQRLKNEGGCSNCIRLLERAVN